MPTTPTLIQIGGLVIQISDLINSILVFFALVGLYLTGRQLQKGSVVDQANFFKELYLTLTSDDMLKALALVEYDKLKVKTDGDMIDEDQDVQLNKLLGFVNTVCILRGRELLAADDLVNFHYVMSRLYKNENVRIYLIFLTRLEHKYNPRAVGPTYPEFVEYCARELGYGPIEELKGDIEAFANQNAAETRGLA